jgi:PadR family transcriptional regulator PadR
MRTDPAKGQLGLLLLAVLDDGSGYGYEIIQELRDRSDGRFDMPEGTVYPALHRLETEGLISGRWIKAEGRRRRTYSLTAKGRAELKDQRKDWREFSRTVESLLG